VVKLRLTTPERLARGFPNKGQIEADRLVALIDQIKHSFAWDTAGAVNVVSLNRRHASGQKLLFVVVKPQ
jgi:hypothetical protein